MHWFADKLQQVGLSVYSTQYCMSAPSFVTVQGLLIVHHVHLKSRKPVIIIVINLIAVLKFYVSLPAINSQQEKDMYGSKVKLDNSKFSFYLKKLMLLTIKQMTRILLWTPAYVTVLKLLKTMMIIQCKWSLHCYFKAVGSEKGLNWSQTQTSAMPVQYVLYQLSLIRTQQAYHGPTISQLPVGLISQLVDLCISNTKARVSLLSLLLK